MKDKAAIGENDMNRDDVTGRTFMGLSGASLLMGVADVAAPATACPYG
jgi:hypothetical protein